MAVRLGIKVNSDSVRCAVSLPHGTGKSVDVVVFTKDGELQKAALAAGASKAGTEDLAAFLADPASKLPDVVIAAPDSMRFVTSLARTLGPKGLMPNAKLGTVTPDVVQGVKNVIGGQAMCRTDKQGVVHVSIGKLSFTEEQLRENMKAVLKALQEAKPEKAKGVYMKKLSLSSTMGPGATLPQEEYRD